jgi:hypothetical protein
MIQLSNVANSIFERAQELRSAGRAESDFGSRFQHLVAAALRSLPEFSDLYENPAAGQPDCYSNRAGVGFEVKCHATPRIEIEPNGWNALRTFKEPRLVAMLSISAPFPVWVVDLKGLPEAAITLEDSTPVDAALEKALASQLNALIEAIGAPRIAEGNLTEMRDRVGRIAAALFATPA